MGRGPRSHRPTRGRCQKLPPTLARVRRLSSFLPRRGRPTRGGLLSAIRWLLPSPRLQRLDLDPTRMARGRPRPKQKAAVVERTSGSRSRRSCHCIIAAVKVLDRRTAATVVRRMVGGRGRRGGKSTVASTEVQPLARSAVPTPLAVLPLRPGRPGRPERRSGARSCSPATRAAGLAWPVQGECRSIRSSRRTPRMAPSTR
mmetsp:Transcript_22213/g.57941  ORF Transcript_22213/g.57941 Transcript_22213/m.57941 type:complete len:201 (+) Transcript_22213:410-1012(+)